MQPASTSPQPSQKSPESRPPQSSSVEQGSSGNKLETNPMPQPSAESAPVPAQTAPVATPSPTTSSDANPGKPTAVSQASIETTEIPAEDVDVIEKEWVERAENIIKTNANDPEREEAEEEALSKEYLKKRFNFDVEDS